MTTRRRTPLHRSTATSDAEAANETVSQHVGFLLSRSHQRFRQAVVAALDGSGLNPGHIAVLGALSASSGLSQAELTTITGIEKSSMVLLVDGLEASNWVRRRPHQTDRRAYALELTAKGVRQLRAIGPKLVAAEESALATLSPTQRSTLMRLLQRLIA
jgi:DNA-binding MarR family transcriptional regulator